MQLYVQRVEANMSSSKMLRTGSDDYDSCIQNDTGPANIFSNVFNWKCNYHVGLWSFLRRSGTLSQNVHFSGLNCTLWFQLGSTSQVFCNWSSGDLAILSPGFESPKPQSANNVLKMAFEAFYCHIQSFPWFRLNLDHFLGGNQELRLFYYYLCLQLFWSLAEFWDSIATNEKGFSTSGTQFF